MNTRFLRLGFLGAIAASMLMLLQACSIPFLFVKEDLPPSNGASALLPFGQTTDLFVMDSGCQCILKVSPDGSVQINIGHESIQSLLGPFQTFFEGIAFDPEGNMFFTAAKSILKQAQDGDLSVLAIDSLIQQAGGIDPDNLGFGSDGNLYVIDNGVKSILKFDFLDEVVELFVGPDSIAEALGLEQIAESFMSIIGGDDGMLYLSSSKPDLIMAVDLASQVASQFLSTDLLGYVGMMTRAPNGDLVVVDNERDNIMRVTPFGDVLMMVLEFQIEGETCANGEVDIRGISFDSVGNFYVADSISNSIYKFDQALECSKFVSRRDIEQITGISPLLNSSMAFSPK